MTATDIRTPDIHTPDTSPEAATAWTRRLAAYRSPIPARSLFELAVTVFPFLALFALSWAALAISPWLSVALSLANAAFVVRLFMIQHDCGHGAFFRSRRVNDWVGRVIGIATLTPYDVWRRNHATHHATTGNLDQRGVGDIPTLTVAEYKAKPPMGRILYRLLRHPVVLFGIAPVYSFFIQSRLPVGQMTSGARFWVSALATDAALLVLLGTLVILGGLPVLVFVYLPMMLLAASVGMWLFYVQHQVRGHVMGRQRRMVGAGGRAAWLVALRPAARPAMDHRQYRRAPCSPPCQPDPVLSAARGFCGTTRRLSGVHRIGLRESLGCGPARALVRTGPQARVLSGGAAPVDIDRTGPNMTFPTSGEDSL